MDEAIAAAVEDATAAIFEGIATGSEALGFTTFDKVDALECL